MDLQAARDNGTFSNVLKKYTKPIVLILDEWLLLKLTEAEARNLFEMIHKRRKKSSTIFCSQFRESEWYQQICDGESTLADAIMDRISYDSYKIDIESVDPAKDLSMREVYEFCFSLCCMECKTVWKSTPIRFSKAGKKPENENRKIIYDTLYDREKNLAFQKALNQAKEIFNICPICKRLVCDHCFLICDDLDMCVQCAAKLNEKGTVVG